METKTDPFEALAVAIADVTDLPEGSWEERRDKLIETAKTMGLASQLDEFAGWEWDKVNFNY